MRLSADTATEAFIVGQGWEQWEINLYITSLLCESGGYGHWMSPVRGREADKGKDIRVSSGSGWTLGPLFYQSSDTLMPWSKSLATVLPVGSGCRWNYTVINSESLEGTQAKILLTWARSEEGALI